MKNILKTTTLTASALLLAASSQLYAQNAGSLNDLLRMVEEDRVAESDDYRERVQEFQQNANRQAEILETTKARYIEQEALQEQLSDTFEQNENTIREKTETLRERRGALNELFGTLQGVAGDFMSNFQNSLISGQYPGRSEYISDFIEKAGSTTDQLAISEIERFWFFMQQEITESAKVVKFNADVALPSGELDNRSVVRIGSFNAIANGDYLSYDGQIGHYQVLPRQPDAGIMAGSNALMTATSGMTRVGIDPTGGVGGQVMANLVNFPTIEEQVRNNSGTIGFIIIGVGIFGILMAFLRLFILTLVSLKVSAQLRSDKASKGNPLGRVLLVAEANPNADTETLELKLGEAILQETPKLEKLLTMIKMIATIAPLGGLLGTVRGMIEVFQQITVYGAGDPTIMAGGISSALMTTVLGIVVAIPTIFMHTVVKSRSDTIIHILEEQATGMIAQKAEERAAG